MKIFRTVHGVIFAVGMTFSGTATAAPGDVDATFNPNANSHVYSTVMQPDGKILIGGAFTSVGGLSPPPFASPDSIRTARWIPASIPIPTVTFTA